MPEDEKFPANPSAQGVKMRVEEVTPSLSTAVPSSAVPEQGPQKLTETLTPSALPKKGFPKAVIFGLVATLFLGAIIFLAVKLKSSDKGLVGKKGEITWWGIWEDEVVVTSLIEEYQKLNSKVKITYVKQSTKDYRERLINALAAGKGPDIFEIHNTWAPMFKNDLEVMPSSVMSAGDFATTFYPVITSDVTIPTGIAAMPLFFDAITLFINEDIFSSAAKSPPRTWDELRTLATQLTQKDERGTILQSGVALGRTENVDHWPEILGLMMFQNKATPGKPTGKLAEDSLGYYLLFSKTDRVWDEKLPPSTIAFAQGKVAMIFAPSWRASEITKANPDLRFKTVPLPQLPKDKPDEPDISYATYWTEAVWKRSINKGDSWDFLKFLSSRESLEKLNREIKKDKGYTRPYPRADMAQLQIDDKVAGSIIALAPKAKSWYLVDETYDGETGLNSQINKAFAAALNPRADAKKDLVEVATEVAKILSQYGIAVK